MEKIGLKNVMIYSLSIHFFHLHLISVCLRMSGPGKFCKNIEASIVYRDKFFQSTKNIGLNSLHLLVFFKKSNRDSVFRKHKNNVREIMQRYFQWHYSGV